MVDLDKFIVNCVVFEKTNEEIAELSSYSVGHIKKRLSVLFKEYNVKSKAGLVREVMKRYLAKAGDFGIESLLK